MSITLLIVIVTCITSFAAFNNPQLMENMAYYPYKIVRQNEYYRILSGAFVHADPTHLLVNMLSYYSFGTIIEQYFSYFFHEKGLVLYVILYFGAVAFAGIVDFIRHKDNYYYTAVGASGGVAAIIFAAILFAPLNKIYLFFALPISSIIFGPLYIAYCIYMDKRGGDNIGHMAHLSGSVFGFVFPILLQPGLLARFVKLLTGNMPG
jgi:membrane associated rhomboid family serine protease